MIDDALIAARGLRDAAASHVQDVMDNDVRTAAIETGEDQESAVAAARGRAARELAAGEAKVDDSALGQALSAAQEALTEVEVRATAAGTLPG